jgi:hypothetical protein
MLSTANGTAAKGVRTMTEKHDCENCGFRARYENNPKSLLGRLWRWHAGWCPGFKKYITSLPQQQRIDLARRYRLEKYSE